VQIAVAEACGSSCSIGIGDTKPRAKLATGFAKPAGIARLDRHNWMPVMAGRPTGALWGVGRRTSAKLSARGINTVAELATADPPERPGTDPFEVSDTGRVHAELLRLPRRQRAVLIARYYDDLSVEQAAELLSCSESTVRAQASRGLQRLRDALEPAHSLAEES